MALETVRVEIRDDSVSAALVDGVVVRVFDSEGDLVTMVQSGELESGIAELELEGASTSVEYLLRFFISGGAVAPKRISVYSPASLSSTGTNSFAVTAQLFELEPADDPKMCRCSGYIANINRRTRARALELIFTPQFNAFVADVQAVITGRFFVRSTADGFCSVDLYRGGIYDVSVVGRDEVARTIQVPDRSSMLLGYLLFPVVVAVEFAEVGPYVVAQGATLTLTPSVRSSDYRELGVGVEDVVYVMENAEIASVEVLSDRIAVRGIAAGTTTLRIRRADESVVYLPDPGIAGGDVTITVTA